MAPTTTTTTTTGAYEAVFYFTNKYSFVEGNLPTFRLKVHQALYASGVLEREITHLVVSKTGDSIQVSVVCIVPAIADKILAQIEDPGLLVKFNGGAYVGTAVEPTTTTTTTVTTSSTTTTTTTSTTTEATTKKTKAATTTTATDATTTPMSDARANSATTTGSGPGDASVGMTTATIGIIAGCVCVVLLGVIAGVVVVKRSGRTGGHAMQSDLSSFENPTYAAGSDFVAFENPMYGNAAASGGPLVGGGATYTEPE